MSEIPKAGGFAAIPDDPQKRQELAKRLWGKVRKRSTQECWEWSGSLTRGYGQIMWSSNGKHRNVKAHRVAYELERGPIPTGLVIDHLCRNRRCVNPAHLDPVPQRENVLRGEANGVEMKLSVREIEAMRAIKKAEGVSYAELGKRFGVGTMTAWRAVKGLNKGDKTCPAHR